MTDHATQGPIAALIAPFLKAERRARWICAAAGALVVLCLCALTLRLLGLLPAYAMVVAVPAGLALLWWLVRRAPDALAQARRLDLRLGTGALLATALESEARPATATLFTRRLQAEAAALAPRLAGLRPARVAGIAAWRDRMMMAAGLAAVLAVVVLVGPAPTVPAAGAALPRAADVQAIADILADDPDPALAEIARDLAALADALASDTPPATAADQLAALAQDIRAARGLAGDADPGVALSVTRAEERLATWLGQEMAFSADAPPGSRIAPRVTADLTPRGGAEAADDTGSQSPPRLDAAVAVDDLDIAEVPDTSSSRPAPAPGDSPFIPPQLVEGAAQEGLAIDMEGAGAAPRQESMDATAGGDGAAPATAAAPPVAPPARAGQELVIIYSGITPRDTPIHYLTEAEAEADVDAHAGASLGDLPDYPRLPAAPVARPELSPAERAALARGAVDGGTP